MKLILTLYLTALNFGTFCQSSNQTHSGNGDNVARDKITNNHYSKNPDETPIILLDKFLDPRKVINIFFGGNVVHFDIKYFKTGEFSSRWLGLDSNIFRLKILGNKILIYAEINGFSNKYVARVRANKLITNKKEQFYTVATEKSFEVYDEYFIPVLQMKIIKKYNCIYFGGVFNENEGYSIVASNGVKNYGFGKPILRFEQFQRDSLLNQYIEHVTKEDFMDDNENDIENAIKTWFENKSLNGKKILNKVKTDICNCITIAKDSLTNLKKLGKRQAYCFLKVSSLDLDECAYVLGMTEENLQKTRFFIRKLNGEVLKNCKEYSTLLSSLHKKSSAKN